jgi:hypothetical protein
MGSLIRGELGDAPPEWLAAHHATFLGVFGFELPSQLDFLQQVWAYTPGCAIGWLGVGIIPRGATWAL